MKHLAPIPLFLFVFFTGLNADAGASFLNLGVGANALAMGGAATAVTRGINALYWNPAGLGWLKGSEAGLMHTEYFQSIRHDNIAFARGSRILAMGLSLKTLYLSGLEERNGPAENPIRTFGAYFFAPSLSIARSFGDYFSIGLNLKTVYETIGDDNALFYNGDIGAIGKTGIRGLLAGICATNLGPAAVFRTSSFSLPTKIRGGISYSVPGDRITVAFDLVKPNSSDLDWCIGISARMNERIFLRTGYRSELRNNGNFAGINAGFGLKINAFDLDYAVSSYGVLGFTQNISLAYIFDRAKSSTSRQEELIADELAKRAQATAMTFYNQGLMMQKSGKYEEALWNFDIALIWNPQFREAIESIGELKTDMDNKKIDECLAAGIAEFNRSNYIDALSSFGRALEIDSTNILARQWLATVSNALVKSQLERTAVDTANVKMISALYEKGLLYYSKKNYPAAIGEWNKVLALDKYHRDAQVYIVKAKEQLQILIQEALKNANQYTAQDKWLQAAKEVKQILSWEPKNQSALLLQSTIRKKLKELSAEHTKSGISFFKQGKPAQAEAEFKVALDFDSTNVTANEYLKKIKTRATDAGGADVNDLYMKGITAYTQENFQAAIRYWRKVLEIDPKHANAKRNIARAEEKLKIK